MELSGWSNRKILFTLHYMRIFSRHASSALETIRVVLLQFGWGCLLGRFNETCCCAQCSKNISSPCQFEEREALCKIIFAAFNVKNLYSWFYSTKIQCLCLTSFAHSGDHLFSPAYGTVKGSLTFHFSLSINSMNFRIELQIMFSNAERVIDEYYVYKRMKWVPTIEQW